MPVVLTVTLCLSVIVAVGVVFAAGRAAPNRTGPSADRYVEITAVSPAVVPAAGPDASTGSFTEDCGRNEPTRAWPGPEPPARAATARRTTGR
ncbi:hypothetical protein SAZ11_50880 [Streptomyces sp. FXJ1.4098]|nr:hypothetical protein [Streptomyces sp. FXJ1.4098]